MIGEPVPVVVFVLVAFAAFAVPTALAFVLFGLLRREGKTPQVIERQKTVPESFPRHRFRRWDRE